MTGTKENTRYANSTPTKDAKRPEALTGDGELWQPEIEYHFFDTSARSVRSSKNLRRVGDHLGAMGLRVVPIAELRTNRDDALTDGQRIIRAEITKLEEQIQNLELQKSPAKRSLKAFLMKS